MRRESNSQTAQKIKASQRMNNTKKMLGKQKRYQSSQSNKNTQKIVKHAAQMSDNIWTTSYTEWQVRNGKRAKKD